MVQTDAEKEEISTRGKQIYFETIKERLTDDQLNMLVAIDVNSGEYEVSESMIDASRRLKQRVPSAEVFILRHGPIVVGRMNIWPTDGVDDSWSLVK